MPFALIERGVMLLLFGLLLVLSHMAAPGERVDKPRRKFSLAFLLSVATGLACIALLHSTTSMDPRKEWFIAALVVIPLCVVLSSVFAVSYWEPILIPLVLFLVSRIFHFMPTDEKEFPPLEYVAVTMVLSLLVAAVGSLVLYLARKIRKGNWSWSLVRGLGWGLPCAVGGMFALKSKMASDIAFRDDYTVVWIILGELVLVSGLAGIKRNKQAVQVASPCPDPGDWRSIRDYSQLFHGGHGINYPAGVAFSLAAFLGRLLQNVAYPEWPPLWETLFPMMLGGLMGALLDGALFLLVSHFVKRTWVLPLAWGVLSETMQFVSVVALSGSLEAWPGLALYSIVAAGLSMAGLVFAVQTWGPRLGSLMAGLIGSAVPLWIYGLILSMPGRYIVVSLVSRAIFAAFLYLGMRRYFEGSWRGLQSGGPRDVIAAGA